LAGSGHAGAGVFIAEYSHCKNSGALISVDVFPLLLASRIYVGQSSACDNNEVKIRNIVENIFIVKPIILALIIDFGGYKIVKKCEQI
jgi:hypothetical protein